MELTGKCKKDFEKWLLKYKPLLMYDFLYCDGEIDFEDLPPSMQYGVYVDFFRQSNHIESVNHIIYDFYENCIIGFTTEEAIYDVVKNANEIYNAKY